ncbi:hypothetical protein Q9L58_003700 [Maublancomyces gigas]|uniref:BAG domain-containing protein n=1 Tax=Discina gigas TaxID=1032678 RepID=A0ABR3GN75_9PEZI
MQPITTTARQSATLRLPRPASPGPLTSKLASSIPLPDFLDPYLGHLTPYLSPYVSSLDDLLTSLQLSISPSTPPKSLPDILPVSIGLASALLALALLAFMRRFFGRSQVLTPDGIPHISGDVTPDPNRLEDFVSIKHGQKEFKLTYPVNAITGGTVSVGDMRERCSGLTGVDTDRISLVCAGKNLKDNSATLKSLGIGHAARILLMGSTAPVPSDPASDSAAKSKKKKKKSGAKKVATTPEPELRKATPMEKIEAVWDGIVANLMPLMDEFMNSPPADAVKRADTHRRLSETMMGELLKLDSVESGEPDVRARRKGVVKDIQKVLDGLDRVLKEQTQVDFDLD